MELISILGGQFKRPTASATKGGGNGQWASLISTIERLAGARSLDDVITILRGTARSIIRSDGIAIVLRDDGFCHYVAEDADEPLWAGLRFPADHCVSGWAMKHRETVIIPDIFDDPRVPVEAYKKTFVKSLVMVPVGLPEPVAAVGAYWARKRRPEPHEIAMLEALSRSAATALENGRLFASLADVNLDLEARVARRTQELEEAHELLRQTQKLEVVGQLTGNVAHDFNNLLAPIMAGLDLILRRGVSDERVLRNVTSAMEAAERAKTLVQRLLAFARRQPLQPSTIDVAALLQGMTDLLSSTLGPRNELRIDIPTGLPRVRVDSNQLEMAILNLAVNARDAMPNGGLLTISAQRYEDGADRPANLPAGDQLCLVVRDSGTGMDEDTLSKAIEPFFSTKGAGSGTGLGLSMVHGLAAQTGGGLYIESKIGVGTTIHLCLPLAPGQRPAVIEHEGDEPEIPMGRGIALVVDDDVLVRMGTADMLSELGFEVKEVESAQEALDAIRGGLVPAIVVTDHLMPGMTGAELASILKKEWPEIPLLLISGYQHVESIAPDLPRLTKPFRHIHLAASISSILNGNAS